MPKISPLTRWLARQAPLLPFLNVAHREPNQEYGGFVGIDLAIPLHESVDLPAESLRKSWDNVQRYVREALSLIKSEGEAGFLDREEVYEIKENMGDPPAFSYPLYFISVGEGSDEKLVYIGRTSAEVGRFQGGHRAISRLHAPEFAGLTKTLYLAMVVLLNEDYLPLEWVIPIEKAEGILLSVEAQLIYHYKPVFNEQQIKRYNPSWPTVINIENHSGYSNFLHEDAVYPL